MLSQPASHIHEDNGLLSCAGVWRDDRCAWLGVSVVQYTLLCYARHAGRGAYRGKECPRKLSENKKRSKRDSRYADEDNQGIIESRGAKNT